MVTSDNALISLGNAWRGRKSGRVQGEHATATTTASSATASLRPSIPVSFPVANYHRHLVPGEMQTDRLLIALMRPG